MKHKKLLLSLLLLSVVAITAMTYASAPVAQTGVCIYEVSVSTITNDVRIGWTISPCADLNIDDEFDYAQLNHSDFKPACPTYSVQAWPNVYLPVVRFGTNCTLNPEAGGRQAAGRYAL